MVATESTVVEAGPTWFLPVKPEDRADEAGVSEEDQEHQLYVKVEDAMNWSIESDLANAPFFGYGVCVGGPFHRSLRQEGRPAAVLLRMGVALDDALDKYHALTIKYRPDGFVEVRQAHRIGADRTTAGALQALIDWED